MTREHRGWAVLSIHATFAAFLILATLAGRAVGDPLEDGRAAYQRGDDKTALRLWLPLADQGDANAQNNLGIMYERGRGVPQSCAEAVKWYRKAADQGVAEAQYNLGIMYERGRGVPQDYAEAVKWYRKVADQGGADAQNKLGVMYANGQGVPQDYVEAYKWYNLAASRFSAAEEKRRDEAVSARDAVAGMMTPAQVAEAQRLASEWKPTESRPK